MIDYSENEARLVFNVLVVPRASRSDIVGEHNGALRVRIAAPPVDGAANEELVRMLARTFKVSRRAVQITGGATSKLKQISITSLSSEAFAELSRVNKK